MAEFMLGCLSCDPCVQRIFSSTDYWVFTLLDPRYKQNLSTLIPVEESSMRVHEYQQALVHKLKQSFPSDTVSGRGRTFAGQVARESRRAGSLSSTGRGTLYKAFASFMSPQQDTVTCPQSRQSRGDLYRKMVREYVADHTIVLNDHTAPYNYWVSRLDMWPQLALYALEVLACPAASVFLERVFSAAGGIITDKRTRLSTDSGDRLTHIKMNQAYISHYFHSHPCESS
ncbi:hypothetical protein GDO81_017102 [Engystomops pustulosus]|uniref:HAT C-terminal dimerisation domain-containing protein n=1 Tax=Engystomops pustulosus TaxID=76066 RepID=A0AAV7AHT2_ENGPU|nr:hypothetical protein GDO81_017102 [Engystomops pustulosus]